jgi:FixJ family two-component response regulator
MILPAPIVFVVDDDESVRRGLNRLFRSAGYQVETFASGEEFLSSGLYRKSPACLVLDLSMPGLTGIDLQERLKALKSALTLVFISGHGDIPTSVRALKSGAVDFLPKPFTDNELIGAVAKALEENIRREQERAELELLQQRAALLTPREREVMSLIVTGKLNKQVAGDLGTTEKTIKVHRAHVLQKMQVQSLAQLVPLAEKLRMMGPPAAR